MNKADTRLDVIIPAQDEEAVISLCLQSLLRQAGSIDLTITVVANGCSDATADVARLFIEPARTLGVQLIVLELPTAGKSQALNTGDRHRRACSVAYIDADVTVEPGALLELTELLNRSPSPLLASPKAIFIRPAAWWARQYFSVWRVLPAVLDDVIGAGCYAVNASGRQRWTLFPDHVQGDDAFVRSHFDRTERVVGRRPFTAVFPDGDDLVNVVRRWDRGNRRLFLDARPAMAADWDTTAVNPSATMHDNLATLIKHRIGPLQTAAFIMVKIAGRMPYEHVRWERGLRKVVPGQKAGPRGPGPRIHVVVVTYNSAGHLRQCLESLPADRADLMVTVVDNASSDTTCDLVERHFPCVRLVRNPENVGFGRAVNAAASSATGRELLLMINPDVQLEPWSVDSLLALRDRFPAAGLYGGASLDRAGQVRKSSALGDPTVSQAMAFAAGVGRAGRHTKIDSADLRGWNRDDVRFVPVLSAAVLLMDSEVFQRIGGFSSKYFLYGEDVDLCIRARKIGAQPVFSPSVRYRHLGGASSRSEDRLLNILKGKQTLVLDHLSPTRARIAQKLFIAGVGVRAIAEGQGAGRNRSTSSVGLWGSMWRRRRDWAHGWR